MDLGCYSSDFAAANSSLFLGRAKVRRVFDGYLPAVGSETWRDTPAGVRPIWSCKAPAGGSRSDGRDWDGALAGAYDGAYAAVFAALPAGARVAVCHEFENKPLTTAEFRQLTERLVPIFRSNAPTGAEYWIISDHFQWNPANSSYPHYQSASEATDVAALCSIVDGAACDVYASSSRGMVSFGSEPGFLRWLDLVGQHAPAIGVPERGITAETATTRADLLIQDAADAASLGVAFYSWWQAGGPAGTDTITDTAGLREMRMWAAAASGN